MMIRISEDLEKRLIARLKQVLSDKKGKITLTHKNGKKEDLIVGASNNCVYIYNTEPDLIRAFEFEGGCEAYEENVKSAACWLYRMSFDDDLISEK